MNDDVLYFQHSFLSVALQPDRIERRNFQKLYELGGFTFHVSVPEIGMRDDYEVPWGIEIPSPAPSPASFLISFFSLIKELDIGTEPIAGDWSFVQRLIRVLRPDAARRNPSARRRDNHSFAYPGSPTYKVRLSETISKPMAFHFS